MASALPLCPALGQRSGAGMLRQTLSADHGAGKAVVEQVGLDDGESVTDAGDTAPPSGAPV